MLYLDSADFVLEDPIMSPYCDVQNLTTLSINLLGGSKFARSKVQVNGLKRWVISFQKQVISLHGAKKTGSFAAFNETTRFVINYSHV